MAILDRVKKRIETDLDDAELQFLIDEANQDVIAKFGPHANPTEPITEVLEGRRQKLVVSRPIETSEPVVITEYVTESGFGETSYVLTATDYRIWPPFIIERRADGISSSPRLNWPDRVEVTYVPVNDGDQREEVIIKLVMLSIQYDALRSRNLGDVSSANDDYIEDRKEVMSLLASRGGLGML